MFTNTSPDAPASRAAPAISTRSGVLGLNLTQRGTSATRDASTTARVADAECANIVERFSRFGQLAFTSSAASAAPFMASAASANSATVRPHIEPTTRAPRRSSPGR